ncbi:MAG TPA: efflux RND transporter permease subunit [Spirochaetota bacterium]|nr:efflux RND transporter permease subunit [Spirochaetota bacterium]HOL57816.1 efflux RND transporter permease subunit [Spirochaetota bacterium]HPP05384.1 efflux RND transporter permease subunit [Spirochaetota bacterium]
MLKFLLNRRRIILLVILPLIIAGLYFVFQLPVKLYPNMRKPVVVLDIRHQSWTAEDFYNEYRDIIENKLNSIEYVENIVSTYSSGRSRFQIEFNWDIGFEDAKNLVEKNIDTIKNLLPEESQDYSVSYWGSNTGFMAIAITSTELPQKDLYNTIYNLFKNKFSNVNDAETVEIVAIQELNTKITLKPLSLLSYGLTPDEVANYIKNNYKNISMGSFRENKNIYNLRIKSGINSPFDIENIPITIKGNKIIYLKDIADISVFYGLPKSLYTVNGDRSILIFATPKEDGNLNRMSTDIKNIINLEKNNLPQHIKFHILVDPSSFITKAINNVINAAIVGGILAIIVIIFFLGEIRNILIISISIPLSIILTFILMKIFNLSLNLISLSGMTLSVGMIVDSSIVAMENIHRHRLMYKNINLIDNIINSIKEVRNAIIASTITSICVFFPLQWTAKLTNAILGDLSKVVIFTLTVSMIVSLLVVPVIAYYLFRNYPVEKEKKNIFENFSNRVLSFLINIYEKILRKILYKKIVSIVLISSLFIILIILLLFIFPLIKKEIIAMPKSNIVQIIFTNSETNDKEILLEKFQEIELKIVKILGNRLESRFVNIFRNDRGSMLINLKNSKVAEIAIEDLKDNLQNNEEWTFEISSWDPSALPLPMTYGLHIRVSGPDKNIILSIVDRIQDIINKSDLYRNSFTSPNTIRSDEINLIPRKEVLRNFNQYSINKLTSIIRILLNGTNVIKIKENEKEINIAINYPDNFVSSIEDIMKYQLTYEDYSIPLGHFFNYEKTKGISQIRNDNGVETFNIFAFMKRDTHQSMKKKLESSIKELLKKELNIPSGYSITFMDTDKEINRNIMSLFIALITSIFLIYLVLGIQFNSLRIPFIILLAIPLGFIGVISSLFIFKSTVSLNSLLGTILLCGISVNNSIIIIDFYIQHIKENTNKTETIINICKLRFTPILLTSLTTIFGMLPIAFAIGDGTNVVQPLGISVTGGLLFSTIFTLIVIPAVLNFLPVKMFNRG